MNTTCPKCERPSTEFDVCADCRITACMERCLSFAELPGYPLCENCALAREEQEHASANAPPRSAPGSESSGEVK